MARLCAKWLLVRSIPQWQKEHCFPLQGQTNPHPPRQDSWFTSHYYDLLSAIKVCLHTQLCSDSHQLKATRIITFIYEKKYSKWHLAEKQTLAKEATAEKAANNGAVKVAQLERANIRLRGRPATLSYLDCNTFYGGKTSLWRIYDTWYTSPDAEYVPYFPTQVLN